MNLNLESLSLSEKQELLDALSERERRLKRRKIFSYYPDTGPLRRELYKQHLEFFRLGSQCSTRAFMAANRVGKCISADTVIECPDGTERKVSDIKGPHMVWAWDGKARVPAMALPPFTKPAEMVYRVWLSSGHWFDCAAEHQLLTESGWSFFSDLLPSLRALPSSSSECGLLASLGDVLNFFQKDQGFPDGCPGCRYSDGEQLQSAAISGRAFVPSQDDVQKHSPALSRFGGLVGKCIDSLLRFLPRLSTRHVEGQIAAQGAAFQYQGAYSSALLCRDSRQESQQLSNAVASESLSSRANRQHQGLSSSLVSPYGLSNLIIGYQPIGVQEIYDFTVPGYHNYCTRGAIHHNTEGGGGYEVTLHLTGDYPEWWEGRRFDKPIDAWVAGDTKETVRDIIQSKLLGPPGEHGTGLIPGDSIVQIKMRQNGNGAADYVIVKHKSGGSSHIGFKSYDQGRESFQGTEKDVIWLDEESNEGVRSECAMRLMTTQGLLIETFTPLKGLTPTVIKYLGSGKPGDSRVSISDDRAMVMAGWDDVPHLSEVEKKRMLAECEPHLVNARSKGIPQLGSGAIYPVEESEIVCAPFQLPDYWPRAYALDVGWNRTAAIWAAIDRDTDTVYLYSEHYRGQSEPVIHAEAIKGRGDWIPGVIDPAARGRSQEDGNQLFKIYQGLGLDIVVANNAVEAGIYEVWQRLSTGKLKVFSTLQNWLSEFRIYRRDEKGKIVKENDHLLDATRYLIMSGLQISITKPFDYEDYDDSSDEDRNAVGGY